MMILRFRDSGESEEMLKKVKKMRKFAEELEDCLIEAMGDAEYRNTSYRHEYDDDEERYEGRMRGRYGYPHR